LFLNLGLEDYLGFLLKYLLNMKKPDWDKNISVFFSVDEVCASKKHQEVFLPDVSIIFH